MLIVVPQTIMFHSIPFKNLNVASSTQNQNNESIVEDETLDRSTIPLKGYDLTLTTGRNSCPQTRNISKQRETDGQTDRERGDKKNRLWLPETALEEAL